MAQFSDLTCFSMHPLKNLNVWGDGGIIVTNSEVLANKLYLMRNHGLSGRDECQMFAYNSRLDTIQAVVANYLLTNRIDNISSKRIEHSTYFDNAFRDIKQISLPVRKANKKCVFHLYMGLFEYRDELQRWLQTKGVDAKIHYPVPMHLQPAASRLGYEKGDFPRAEYVANNCLSLPVHEFISQSQQEYVVESIMSFYEQCK
jgi:dTDP-4-amino-4,6-dideoxygalactose transaminase